MTELLIRHPVEDYEEWKSVFDDHAPTRQEHGSKGYRLFHVADDPNELVALFEWDSAENAREFLDDPELRALMEQAGVVGEPDVHLLEEIETKTPETPRT